MSDTFEKPIGLGRTADVYNYTDSAVVKLLKASFPERILDYEAKIHTAVQNLGLPIPKLLDKVNIDGRPGLVYEKINGITMTEAIKSKPRSLFKYARAMAALHADIGSCEAEGLPPVKENLLSCIDRQTILTERVKRRAKTVLETLESGQALCHRDFHPYNIMIEGDKYWVIDWTNSARGSFGADVMRTLMILGYARDPSGQVSEALACTAGFLLKNTYIKHLMKLSGYDKEKIYSWELPTIAARFSEDVPPAEEAALKKRFKKLPV